MKKLLLIAASTAILSSSVSFADCDMSATDSSTSSSSADQWYLKLNAGATIFDKTKPINNPIGKLKSNTGFTGNIGAGYYIMDNLRTDLTIGTVTNVHLKKSATVATTTVSVKHKPTILNALLNGYVDFIDLSMFKVFAGGGVGLALVKEKVSVTTKTTTNGNVVNSSAFSGTTKNKTNFAYQLSLGTSFEVADGVKAELVYSWADFGKSKTNIKNVFGTKVKYGGTRYKGNNLMAGLRFDM